MAEAAAPLGAELPSAGAASAIGPWPENTSFEAGGLRVTGVSAIELAHRYGTPLLVFDEEHVRARMQEARRAFPRAMYAVKAFTSHAVVRIAIEEGLDVLASTGGEVEACLRAGAPAARVAMHGRNKSDEELELAVRSRLGLLIVDGADELRRADAIARAFAEVQPVLLRVIPDVRPDTHEAIATGHEAAAFGTPLADAPAVAELAGTLPGIRFAGLHAHIGSQILEPEPFLQEVDALADLLVTLRDRSAPGVELLDVGGGFGITYLDERAMSLSELALPIASRLADRCAAAGLVPPTLIVEPGRILVGNAAVTLYRVGDRRELKDGRRLLAVDGGMSDNIRPMLYDARYTVALAGPVRATPTAAFTIVGRHCESGDVLAEDVVLPSDAGRGDLVAFAATGAYTYPLASNYNRVGRPAVVAVRSGRTDLWARREDAADLDRLEMPPRRTPPGEPPDGIVVRPARPRDARSFLSFWSAIVAEGRFVRSEAVQHTARVYRRRFRRAWSDREAQVVALDGDAVVGHVYVQRESHPVTRHVGTLGIAVADGYRGRGIGTALMTEALRWATGVGIEKIVLSVYPANAAAIALYRTFGFVDEGRLVGHSRKSYGYEDEVLMAAWIGGERR